MEQRDARLFRPDLATDPTADPGWNVITLESHKQLRCKVQQLIRLAGASNMTTEEIRQHLQLYIETYGRSFALHLVRMLQSDDEQERQSIVWLLTVLNDANTIAPLEQMTRDETLSRAVRLAAGLALAGMGVLRNESSARRQRVRLSAIS
jgi:HEAT repeat protein